MPAGAGAAVPVSARGPTPAAWLATGCCRHIIVLASIASSNAVGARHAMLTGLCTALLPVLSNSSVT
jgi:hypothetical protein